jgi:hypothetical protein
MLFMEALQGADVSSSNSKAMYCMEFINQIRASANLHPRKNQSIHWTW